MSEPATPLRPAARREEDPALRTRASLLLRLREDPRDPCAWRDLVDRYGPMILAWCRRHGLQSADAQDATQAVLLKLAEKLATFRYDPARSFRSYLKTLTHYACLDLQTARGPCAAALQDLDARDDLTRVIQEAHDQSVLAQAMERVASRVEPRTWDAFRLLAFEGRSGADAANALGMSVVAVFKARSRVQQMLTAEIREIDPP